MVLVRLKLVLNILRIYSTVPPYSIDFTLKTQKSPINANSSKPTFTRQIKRRNELFSQILVLLQCQIHAKQHFKSKYFKNPYNYYFFKNNFRVAALFNSKPTPDNSMISVYPFGDELYAFGETPVLHKINKETLATEDTVDVSDYVTIVHHTSHPHVMSDGDLFYFV